MFNKVWEIKRPANADQWDPGITVKYEGTKEELQAKYKESMHEALLSLKRTNPDKRFGKKYSV